MVPETGFRCVGKKMAAANETKVSGVRSDLKLENHIFWSEGYRHSRLTFGKMSRPGCI